MLGINEINAYKAIWNTEILNNSTQQSLCHVLDWVLGTQG